MSVFLFSNSFLINWGTYTASGNVSKFSAKVATVQLACSHTEASYISGAITTAHSYFTATITFPTVSTANCVIFNASDSTHACDGGRYATFGY